MSKWDRKGGPTLKVGGTPIRSAHSKFTSAVKWIGDRSLDSAVWMSGCRFENLRILNKLYLGRYDDMLQERERGEDQLRKVTII